MQNIQQADLAALSRLDGNPPDLYGINPRVWNALSNYGIFKVYRTESGRKIMTFPTCSTPLHHLAEENWEPSQRNLDHGNYRKVRHAYQLKNGEPASLYTKGSEYKFYLDLKNLEKGDLWWGGPNSGKKYGYVFGSVVEEQVEWEAVFLLELLKNKIPAEIPQALIRHEDGKEEIVVLDVCKTDYGSLGIIEYPYAERMAAINGIGLKLEDEGGHNYIQSKDGLHAIIDVNRCIWKPHTDDYRRELLQAILDKLT